MDLSQKFENQIFFSVTRIVAKSEDNKSASIGTGFILKVPTSGERCIFLLVTNRHVIPKNFTQIDLVFHCNDGKGKPSLSKFQSVVFNNYKKICYFHPDEDVDLAALNLSGLTSNPQLYWRHLEPNLFLNPSVDEIKPGDAISFIGYPDNRFDVLHNLPLLRKGFIASHPHIDFNGKPEVVIDAQVFPGSSGSPVFVAVENQAKLLGVVSETMVKNNKLQTIPAITKKVKTVKEVLGLGIVIKSEALKALIDDIIKKI